MDNSLLRRNPPPILTVRLFPGLLTGLLDLLATLSGDDWTTPIPKKSWSVKDVALHLLSGDIGILSRRRDGYVSAAPKTTDYRELVEFLRTQNDTWIRAAQRISPGLLRGLLGFTGRQVQDYFESLDPNASGESVSWTGPGAAPNWLNIAQEYTERWHHQQHIREALARPGFMEERFLRPALDTFIRALPHTYRDVRAPEDTVIQVTISGDSGGVWLLVRERNRWGLYIGSAGRPRAAVVLPQEMAWKLFTKWATKDDALRASEIQGERSLVLRVFDMVSVIA